MLRAVEVTVDRIEPLPWTWTELARNSGTQPPAQLDLGKLGKAIVTADAAIVGSPAGAALGAGLGTAVEGPAGNLEPPDPPRSGSARSSATKDLLSLTPSAYLS